MGNKHNNNKTNNINNNNFINPLLPCGNLTDSQTFMKV